MAENQLAQNIAATILGELLGDQAPNIDMNRFMPGMYDPEKGEVVLVEDLFAAKPALAAFWLAGASLAFYLKDHTGDIPGKEEAALKELKENFSDAFWAASWLPAEARKFKTLAVRRLDDKIALVGYSKPDLADLPDEIKEILSQMKSAETPADRAKIIKEALGKVLPPGLKLSVFGIEFGKEQEDQG